VRPVVTATTAGTGNWFVSLVEDIIAFFVSLLSILLPILAGIAVLIMIVTLATFYRRRKKRRGLAFDKS
jgi:Flp pilus assembly protein TadB